MGSTGKSTAAYITRTEPIRVDIGNGRTSMSYGEGTVKSAEGNYHVYLTDRVGGQFIDKGTFNGYTIGQKVLWKYSPSDIGEPKEMTIKTAHKYPNGKVEFLVSGPNMFGRIDGHNTDAETLDLYNKRKRNR